MASGPEAVREHFIDTGAFSADRALTPTESGFLGITNDTGAKLLKGTGIMLVVLVGLASLAALSYYGIYENKDAIGNFFSKDFSNWFVDQGGGILTGVAIVSAIGLAILARKVFNDGKHYGALGIFSLFATTVGASIVLGTDQSDLLNQGFSQWQGLALVGGMACLSAPAILALYIKHKNDAVEVPKRENSEAPQKPSLTHPLIDGSEQQTAHGSHTVIQKQHEPVVDGSEIPAGYVPGELPGLPTHE